MSTSTVNARRLTVAGVTACGVVMLSACSGSGSTGNSASSASSMSVSSSSTPAASRSAAGAGSSSSGSAAPSARIATPAKPKTDPVAACTTANGKSNAAIGQWNSAVSTQSGSKLDAAARNFRSTATALRALPHKAGNAGFTARVTSVANDLDAMAKARFAGQTVNPTTYNQDSEKLRSYCQTLITKK